MRRHRQNLMVWDKQQSPMVADPSSNSNWMLDHHIMLMTRAEAEKDWWKFWVYAKFVLKRILPYMDVEARQALEADWQELDRLEREIETGDDPEATKSRKIEKLRLGFIKAHESYISMNLPRTGLITVSEDATIDFSKKDFEVLKRAVRADTHDVARTVDEAQQRAEAKKDGTPG